MPRKKYLTNLSDVEREKLLQMTHKGTLKVRLFKRAMILLKADEGLSDPQIMASLNVSRPCVERIRKRFVADGPLAELVEVDLDGGSAAGATDRNHTTGANHSTDDRGNETGNRRRQRARPTKARKQTRHTS